MPKDYFPYKSCRICLVKDSKYSKFVTFDDSGGWLAMYEFCFGLTISTEDVPRILCNSCAGKMKDFNTFKLQAQKSDKLWKTIANITPGSVIENCQQDVENKSSLLPIQEECEEVNLISSDSDVWPEDDKESCEILIVKKEEKPANGVQSETDSDYDLTELEKFEILEEENPANGVQSETDSDFDLTEFEKFEILEETNNLEEIKNDDKKNKVYTCPKCNMQYKRLKFYKKHLKKPDCKDVPVPKKVEQKELYCGLCETWCPDSESLNKHINEHSTKDDLSCGLCDYIGRDFADMETHRFSHQRKDGPRSYICHLCGKLHCALLVLQFHYRTVHLNKTNGGWCSYCNKEFRTYIKWRDHERHHRSSKYICDHCGKTFLYRATIITHLQDIGNENAYICDVCGKGFKRARALKLHQETMHDTVQATCAHCNKVFRNQKHVDLHMVKLSKQKSHQCHVCSKLFFTPFHLKRHMAWHFDDRPYKCEICDASYKVKNQLTIHMRKHSGFMPHKCTICPKEFATTPQLRVHLSVHSGMRRHKCPYCERSFHNRKDLVLHCDKRHYVSDFQISGEMKDVES
ncbi:zinc finger protein 675-like [Ostrinia furnacalis]|uniref:zinc finger protein 675-like n=1 Tax=Ostrinia furnacalis TaxID=93504 RepID=UPI00103FA95F|nr:zinc finger protein 675-like [Ostrinia furnacalis]